MHSNDLRHPQELSALSKPEAQHQQLLDGLHSIDASLKALIQGRAPFYQTVAISATVPIDLDYRDRKYVFIYSPNALTLSLEDLGTIALAANTWTNISFAPGTRIYATGQATRMYVGIKQTDDLLAGNGALESGGILASMQTDFAELLLDTDNVASILTQVTNRKVQQGAVGGSGYSYVWGMQQSLANQNIPAGVGTTVVKASAGSLATIVILTTGTAALQIFDNVNAGTGQMLWQSVAAPAQGTVINIFGAAIYGITALGQVGSPQAIVYFS